MAVACTIHGNMKPGSQFIVLKPLKIFLYLIMGLKFQGDRLVNVKVEGSAHNCHINALCGGQIHICKNLFYNYFPILG